jgi:hypothetical protein
MNNKEEDMIKNIMSKLLGKDNIPDDTVIKATINDNRLLKVAEYDALKGYTLTAENPEVTQLNIQSKFAEFKKMVLSKSSTLAELETMVFSRYGILEKPRAMAGADQLEMPQLGEIKFSDKKVIGFAVEPQKRKDKKNEQKTKTTSTETPRR